MRVLAFLGAMLFGTLGNAADPIEEPIWPAGSPGLLDTRDAEVVKDNGGGKILDRHVSNVHKPTLTVYLPPKEKATGASVVICPGGGYGILALDKEGHDVARWFNEIGVAGFVLKYRLPRPKGHVYPHDVPLKDAQRAVRMVRARGSEWGVDPQRIGLMGFSAGGHLAATAGTHFDNGRSDASNEIEHVSSRPDFLILIYPVVTFTSGIAHPGSARALLGDKPDAKLIEYYSADRQVTAQTPPTFLVYTDDDPIKPEHAVLFYQALRKAKVKGSEMHIFAKGGHGYGLRKEWNGEKDPPISMWPNLCAEWMRGRGLLKRTP